MSESTCYEKLRSLEKKGCVDILSTDRAGTRVRLRLPDEIPGVVPKDETPPGCFYCLRRLDGQNHVVEHVRSRPHGNNSYRNVVAACIQCNNRKGATAAEDYVRALYRGGFLSEAEFQQRLAMLVKLSEGSLKPDFARAVAP